MCFCALVTRIRVLFAPENGDATGEHNGNTTARPPVAASQLPKTSSEPLLGLPRGHSEQRGGAIETREFDVRN